MTKWIEIWGTAAAIISTVVMMSSLIHAAVDIVTVDCSAQLTFQPPSNISCGGNWSQTFRINASTVPANGICSFTLDARWSYALNATSVTIGDNATTVMLDALDQYYLRYNLNSSTTPPNATGFIATRVSISVHRGAAVTNDSQFNVTLTVNWHRFNYTGYSDYYFLRCTCPWAVVNASKPGGTMLYAQNGVTPRLYVVDFGNGTAKELAANQGVLIYKTDRLTDAPERAVANYSHYMSSGGSRLPPSEQYMVYVDERYSANKLMLVFILDTPNTPNLYPITPNNVTTVANHRYSSTPIMVLPHPSFAAVRLDNLQSSSNVSVVVGTPRILGICPVIFNSRTSVSQLPEWNGTLVRSRLFTILGTNLNVTLTGVTTLNVTNARVRQRGVFMSRGYGESYDYRPAPDAQDYYINDVHTVILDNDTSARTISYQIDSAAIYYSDWMSFSALDGSQATSYTYTGYSLQGRNGSVNASSLKLQSLSTSSSGHYLVRWTVSSAVGQFLPPAVLALSMLTSLLLY